MSDDTYLWYSEITDQDPGNFTDPLAYFADLKTFATTPTGTDRDQFHFTVDSQEWFDLTQSGVSAGYGSEWAFISATVPRNIVVAYTEPGSYSGDQGFWRLTVLTLIPPPRQASMP